MAKKSISERIADGITQVTSPTGNEAVPLSESSTDKYALLSTILDHTKHTNIGSNTHAQVDTAIGNLPTYPFTATDTPSKNDIPKWNGTEFQYVQEGDTFTFSIASFTATGFTTGTQLANAAGATFKAIGAVTYSATYSNGPATGGYVSSSGHSNLTLENDYAGPTTNTEAYTYPSLGTNGATRTVTLNATDGSDPDTSTKTATFHNYCKIGPSSDASGWDQTDYDDAGLTETITSDGTRTWAAVALSNEYLVLWLPQRITQPTQFFDDDTGFAFDMQSAVSVAGMANDAASPLTEDYYVYRSTNLLTGTKTLRTA